MSSIRTPKWRRGALALIVAITTFIGGTAAGQDFTVGWNPRSGDVWVDTWLGDMNRYGSRYPEPFIDEMVRYHGAPRDLVGRRAEHQPRERRPHRSIEALVSQLHFVDAKEPMEDFSALKNLDAPVLSPTGRRRIGGSDRLPVELGCSDEAEQRRELAPKK